MHRALFLIISILAFASMRAQVSFSVDTTYAEASHPASEAVFYPWIELTNNSGTLLEMRCVKVLVNKPAAWETWLQYVDTLYPIIPDTATFFLPAINEPAQYLIVSFHPHQVVARATVIVKVYPANNPADSVLLTFQGNARQPIVNALEEATPWLPDFNVYPQPVENELYIATGNVAEVKTVMLVNGLGQTIAAPWELRGETIHVDVNGLPSGIYFIVLRNAQGQQVARRWWKQ